MTIVLATRTLWNIKYNIQLDFSCSSFFAPKRRMSFTPELGDRSQTNAGKRKSSLGVTPACYSCSKVIQKLHNGYTCLLSNIQQHYSSTTAIHTLLFQKSKEETLEIYLRLISFLQIT